MVWWLLSGDAEFRIQDMVIHSQMRLPPRFLQQMFQKIAEFCLSESEYLFNEIKNLGVPLLYKTKQIWDKKTSFIDHQIMLQRKSEWRGAGDNPVSKHTSKTIENGNVSLKTRNMYVFWFVTLSCFKNIHPRLYKKGNHLLNHIFPGGHISLFPPSPLNI